MWIILCSSADHSAQWAHEGLRARGLAPLELIFAERLPGARWVHRVGTEHAEIAVTLPDGRHVDGASLNGALNRMMAVPPPLLDVAQVEDREYASQELHAFFAGWLASLPGNVLNPASAQGLCGRWIQVSEMTHLAARAGLPTAPLRFDPRDPPPPLGAGGDPATGTMSRTVIVVGRRVVGAGMPAPIESGCLRLSGLTCTPLLGISFALDGNGAWTFSSATPLPDLMQAGEPLLDALAEALTQEEGSS